jgi:hypothetical protein
MKHNFKKIRTFHRTLAYTPEDIQDLAELQGDTLMWRRSLALCLSGKVGSELMRPGWNDEGSFNEELVTALHTADTQLDSILAEELEQSKTDMEATLEFLSKWRARLPHTIQRRFYPGTFQFFTRRQNQLSPSEQAFIIAPIVLSVISTQVS